MPPFDARRALLAACALPALWAAVPPPTPGAPNATARAVAAEPVVVGTVRSPAGDPVGGATVMIRALGVQTVSGTDGRFALAARGAARGATVTVEARLIGYAMARRQVRLDVDTVRVDLVLTPASMQLSAVVVADGISEPAAAPSARSERAAAARRRDGAAKAAGAVAAAQAPVAYAMPAPPPPMPLAAPGPWLDARGRRLGDPRPRPADREQYDRIDDNPFLAAAQNPRSTFSLDVDRASYANMRRFLTAGQRPPADAVRLEELINYFPYDAPDPRGGEAVGVTSEVAAAPWRPAHRLVRVAVQARHADDAERKAANLVFLVDVSGSMMSPDKLPLVKRALGVLVDRLRPEDRVALVVYAGNAGLVLPSTPGSQRQTIRDAIERLEAGGSTAGGAGLELAYTVARAHAGAGVNSRVVLATDGDFNVGVSSDAELERLVERRRGEGTYLTVLGFGTGNLQDAKMKKLAKRGNGNYAYVDDLAEARKVFGQELGGTLETVANDAKIQVEFNPARVRAYRLLGYEGRLLRDEDFADDAKDAGDVGAGHTATALYEVVPAGVDTTVSLRGVPALRYGEPNGTSAADAPARRDGGELLFVQLRYKVPGQTTSRLVTHAVRDRATQPGADFRFASAVAEFGMLLRESPFRGGASTTAVLARARGALGRDVGGHRAEFVGLVERYAGMVDGMAAR